MDMVAVSQPLVSSHYLKLYTTVFEIITGPICPSILGGDGASKVGLQVSLHPGAKRLPNFCFDTLTINYVELRHKRCSVGVDRRYYSCVIWEFTIII